jgi:hypothetical protein
MAHRGFDEQIEALEALKDRALDNEAVLLVKKSLASRNNYVVAKAARLAEESSLLDLVPDMLAAFDRFFTNPEKSDPQCWAKNALSKALTKLECRDKQVFLRGLRHHQMEPVWGGKSDSAGTLRAQCAHALIACDGVDNQQLLVYLLEPLVDKDKSVRVEAVRAIAQLGESATAVLRLRALIPGEEPEILAACFNGLLDIDRDSGLDFVASFLEAADDSAAEAALALAQTRTPQALAFLLHRHKSPMEPWLGGVLLSAIALTRLLEAVDFLMAMIERDDREAPAAIEALARLVPNDQLILRIEQAVQGTDSFRLKKALREHLPTASID